MTIPEMRAEANRIDDYYTFLASIFRKGMVPTGSVLVFMQGLCNLLRGTLRFDWVSMGVCIGVEGAVVSPLSILRVALVPHGTNIGTGQHAISKEQILHLGLLIMGGYRIHCASNHIYM